MARPRLHLLITLFLILTFAAWAHPRTFHNNPAIGADDYTHALVRRAENGTTQRLSAPSSGGWGLDVWSSTAVGLRKMFQGSVGSKETVTVQRVVSAYIRALILIALMILLAFGSIAIGIVVSVCCIGRARKVPTLSDRDRTYFSIAAVAITTFAVCVCLITGSRGSAYLTTSITTLNETITVIPSNIRASLQRVPAVIDETVATLSVNINDTIDYGVNMAVDVQRISRSLVGTPEMAGPGELLMEGFKMLTDLVVAFAKNTTDVNEYAGTIGNNSDAFNRDLLFLNRNITLLNSIFNSTSNRTLRFELRTKLPLISNSSEITNSSVIVRTASANSLSPLAEALNGLPDFPGIYATISPLFLNISGTFLNFTQNATAPSKSNITEKIMSSGLKASTESVNSTAAFQEDVEEWRRVVAKYMDDGKGGGVLYYNGIRAIVTPLLFASAALMMILIVTSTVVKVPFLVHIALPNITILTFLMLLIGAGFFAVAVVLGDGCHLVVQERGAVLSNMYNTKTVENFFAARDQCLSDPSRSLVQFASQIGVNMEAINLTVAAAPTIDELDLSKFPRLNLTDIIPGTVTAFREQSITELFTSINETLGLNFFAPLRTFNFTTTQRSLATLKASLAPFIGSPSDYASTQISTVPNSTTVLRDFDLDEFDVIVRNIIALQSGLERNVNAIVEAIEKTIDAVNGMSIGIERGQSAGGGVPVYLNATLALLNQFSDEVNRNIPRFTPVAKSMLYEIVNANYERALAKLPCENLASETLVLQQSVCVGISESFDIMWFAFMACGVSLLICLSCLGCITNRLVTGIPPWSQTIKRDASMSTISTSSGTLFNDGRRRKFGKVSEEEKAEYTLKPVKNADDLLPEDVYSPEWATTHQPFGSGDTFSDQPPIAPVAEFNERMPPSPVLSSASAARGRQILVAPLPGEIRGRSSRRTSDVPKGVNSSMANYFKE